MPENQISLFTLPTQSNRGGFDGPNLFEDEIQQQKVASSADDGISLSQMINGTLGALGSGGVNFLRKRTPASAIFPIIGGLSGLSNEQDALKNPTNAGNIAATLMSATGKGSPMAQSVFPQLVEGSADFAQNPSAETLTKQLGLTGAAALSPRIAKSAARKINERGVLEAENKLNELNTQGRALLDAPDYGSEEIKGLLRDSRIRNAAQRKVSLIDELYGAKAKEPFTTTTTVSRRPSTVTPTEEIIPVDKKAIEAKIASLRSSLKPETDEVVTTGVNKDLQRKNQQLLARADSLEKQAEKILNERQQFLDSAKLAGNAETETKAQRDPLLLEAAKLRTQITNPDTEVKSAVPNRLTAVSNRKIQAEIDVLEKQLKAPPQVRTRASLFPGEVESRTETTQNPIAQRRAEWDKLAKDKSVKLANFTPAIPESVDNLLKQESRRPDPALAVADKLQTKYFQSVGKDSYEARKALEMMGQFRTKYPKSLAPVRSFTQGILTEAASNIPTAGIDRGRQLNPESMRAYVEKASKLPPEAKVAIFGSEKEANEYLRFLATVPDAIERGGERYRLQLGGTAGGNNLRIGLDSIAQIFNPDALVNLWFNRSYDKTGQASNAINLIRALASDDKDIVKMLSQPGNFVRTIDNLTQLMRENQKAPDEKKKTPSPKAESKPAAEIKL